jgi:hypothetical protein
MTTFKMTLAGAAAAALMAAIGAAVAQTPIEDTQAAPQASVAPGDPLIYHFKDQGNSPETDPSAHLLLIKHGSPYQASTTVESSQTVADATPAQPAPPAPAYDSSTTSTNTTTTTTDLSSAPTDNSSAMPAPKADRN